MKGAYGGLPYPTTHQFKHPWHGKGSANLLSEAPYAGPESYPGFMLSRLSEVRTPSAPNTEIAGGLPSAAPAAPSPRAQIAGGLLSAAPAHVDSGSQTTKRQYLDAQIWEDGRPKVPRDSAAPGLKTLIEKRSQSLRPLSDEWEKLTAILDSGASVTVVPPHVGRDYELTRGDAAAAGVRYEIADGNEITNLGEKLLPIMTREGTWRSLKAEVADISRPLQPVRSLIKTGHRVVFGGGDDGNFHYIENIMTGEINAVEDDGSNYFMTYVIAPKAQASFAGQTR